MQAQSRKRPAPGTSPIPPNTQQEPYPTFAGVTDPSQLSNEQLLSWGGASNDLSAGSSNNQNYTPVVDGSRMGGSSQAQQTANQLVRRNMNHQLATRDGRNASPSTLEMWQEYEGTPQPGVDAEHEDDAELEARAAAAKRDALAKRKQIPPFIQKLVSFLEKSYTDLIRWSDSGDSFIVVDEDKFAQKLIPELFKHNNYASFVRQLNMYGFHKVVGLSDNSMRASEKKAKTPSEYKHRYFKRGRPDLLWLIEKPKSGTSNPKKKNVKHEMHDDDDDEDEGGEGHVEDAQTQPRQKDLTTVPKADLDSFRNLRREVEALQKSQQQIFSILARMRDENNQYIRQASTMVANHERHESSINAILTFLATFYNQSLEDRGNASNMFAHAIHNNQPQGSVFDVGDYNESSMNQSNQFQTQPQPQPRRPLALLPPPTASDSNADDSRAGSTSRADSATPRRASQSSRRSGQQQNSFYPSKPSPQPASTNSPSQTNDNDDILNVINRSNANAPQGSQHGPNFDFNSALQHYQNSNGKGPLTNEQRDAMLSIMANNSGTSTPAITNDTTNTNQYLDYFNSNQEQLDMLHRLQQEQDSKVQELAGRLSPLSPNGSIPGLDQNVANQSLPYPSSFDIDNFINDDFLDGNVGDDSDPNFDFGTFGGDDANTFKPAETTTTGRPQPQNQDEDQSAAAGSNDGSLFGDGDGDGDEEEEHLGQTPTAESVKAESTPGTLSNSGGGRIVGSVASSSGRPTPSVEDADEDEGDGNPQQPAATAAEEENPRKRRRTAARR